MFFLSTTCAAAVPQYYAYINSAYKKPAVKSSFFYQLGSLFYQLGAVIGVLDQYENNKYRGVKLDFGYDGKYYSRYKGGNWWEYFFTKLNVGDTTGEFRSIPRYEQSAVACCLYELSFERAHELIEKYIHIKT